MSPSAEPQPKSRLMKELRPLLTSQPYRKASGFLLCVSGGLDSMVMLDLFHRMAHVHGRGLRVFHVHHGTGSFADTALAVVQAFCESRGISLTVQPYRHQSGNFEYEAAAFRRETAQAQRRPGERILLAHHRRDQVETFFQAMVRGAGPGSPLAMEPCRDVRLRPLLKCSRQWIAEHGLVCRVPHVSDPSNADTGNFRNAIRHQVLPLLDQFHGRCEQRVASWLDDYARLTDALDRDAASAFQTAFKNGVLDRRVFRCEKAYLWGFILKRFWEAVGVPKPGRQRQAALTSWLEQNTCGSFQLKGYRFHCDLDGLAVVPETQVQSLVGTFGETLEWGPFRFCFHWLDLPGAIRAGGPTSLRLVSSGPQPKPVRELMRASKIPHRWRSALPDVEIGGKRAHLLQWLCLQKPVRLIATWLDGPHIPSQVAQNCQSKENERSRECSHSQFFELEYRTLAYRGGC